MTLEKLRQLAVATEKALAKETAANVVVLMKPDDSDQYVFSVSRDASTASRMLIDCAHELDSGHYDDDEMTEAFI